MKMSEEMAKAVSECITEEWSYEPAMPAEDVLILDLLSEGIAERVTESNVRRLLGLTRQDRWSDE